MNPVDTRRSFLRSAGTGIAVLVLDCHHRAGEAKGGSGGGGDSGGASDSGPRTDSGDSADCAETPVNTEGPFYVSGAPVRTELDLYGDSGTSLQIAGRLTDSDCRPLAGGVIEIWHADPAGAYDNDSPEMRYRGQFAADSDGRYSFHTLVPGRYLNGAQFRPAHIHVKVWIDGVERLTTQIYFAGDPYLESDAWAEEGLTIALADDGTGGLTGTFDIALQG